MEHHKVINGIKFKAGLKSQERTFKNGQKLGHHFYVATDFKYFKKSSKKQFLSKAYTSFKSYEDFLKVYYPRLKDSWHCYEILKQNVRCKVYFDLDYDVKRYKDDSEVIEIFTRWVKKIINIPNKESSICFWTSTNANKGSLHVVLQDFWVRNNELLKDFVKQNITDNVKDIIDWKVYTKNRLFRIVYSKKMDESGTMLIPVNTSNYNPTLTDNLITNVETYWTKELKI